MTCDVLQPTTTAAEVPAEEAEEAATAEEAEKAEDSRKIQAEKAEDSRKIQAEEAEDSLAGTTAGSVEVATCATVEAVGRAHP